MAGGIGSRFWPYSRQDRPKQFLDILNTGRSLLQMTYDRFTANTSSANVYVVTNDRYGPAVKEQLPALTDDQILCEPSRKNTAPCIAYAAYKIAKINSEAVITVTPSDHVIFNEPVFNEVLNTAVMAADDHKLLTIGLKPNRPETGYGYIQYLPGETEVKKVKTFTEKPERELAQKFLDSGDFVWNSGMFIWSAKAIIGAFEKILPEMAELFQEAVPAFNTPDEKGAIEKAYYQCNNVSIDYGIMEKAKEVYVVLGDFGWSDLGSWESLHELSNKNEDGNAIQGNALLFETTNSMIKGSKEKLIVAQGLDDYLVAECDNVILICKKSEEHKFREYVAGVKDKKGPEYL
ncbi:mannose-1-phosphate guanylyltransferase [Fulvivirga sp. M361]|nr:mannose-1-phosphate guanylyltransferase [Fulvivirga sp. M361]